MSWRLRKWKRNERDIYVDKISRMAQQFTMNSDDIERLEETDGQYTYFLTKRVYPAYGQFQRMVELHFREEFQPRPTIKTGTWYRHLFVEQSDVTKTKPYYKDGIDRDGWFYLFRCWG